MADRDGSTLRMGSPTGESLLEAQTRAVAACEDIAARKGTVVAVTHADIIKAVVSHYLGQPLDLFQRIGVAPTSVTVLDLVQGWPPHGPGGKHDWRPPVSRLDLGRHNGSPQVPSGALGNVASSSRSTRGENVIATSWRRGRWWRSSNAVSNSWQRTACPDREAVEMVHSGGSRPRRATEVDFRVGDIALQLQHSELVSGMLDPVEEGGEGVSFVVAPEHLQAMAMPP